MLTDNDIVKIKYFTARVKNRVGDLDVQVRQNTYLRALTTNPKIEIIYGHFLTNDVWMVKASDEGKDVKKIDKIKVIKTEEKGSDVNIATHLLMDGFKNLYEVAAVITNDSDLKLPIGLVKSELRKTVGVLCPHEKPSRELIKQASFFKSIKKETFLGCQLPEEIKDRAGMIKKPSIW